MATVHYTICGLEYVFLTGVKIKKVDGEEFVDLPPQDIFKAIAEAVVTNSIPLRGREVQFLRKTVGMKKTELAARMGITSAGVSKWENQPDRLLSKVNQAALKIIIAEVLGVNGSLPVEWDFMATDADTPSRLEVEAA
jgi:DNA-binding transcriptional regulator YiaG